MASYFNLAGRVVWYSALAMGGALLAVQYAAFSAGAIKEIGDAMSDFLKA